MKNKKQHKKKLGYYIIGSIAVTAGATIVMPKLIGYLSDKIYKITPTDDNENEDFEPEIIKHKNS